MIHNAVIFALVIVAITAFPAQREAHRTDSDSNQALDKTELRKDADVLWKTQIESSTLYNSNPMGGEVRYKLNMESERLRVRLRQELAQLQQRLSPLSPYPAQPPSALGSVRERLAPLIQQLQSSVSASTRDVCDQLRVHLLGLQAEEGQPGAALNREAVQWISRALEDNGAKMDAVVQEFQTQACVVIKELTASGVGEGTGAALTARLGQEVRALRQEAQSRTGSLKAELGALLVSGPPLRAEVSSSLNRFCQSITQQNQLFQSRIERLVLGLEEENQASSSSSSSSSSQEPDVLISIQEDFPAKLSALLQDIRDSLPEQSHS